MTLSASVQERSAMGIHFLERKLPVVTWPVNAGVLGREDHCVIGLHFGFARGV